MPDEGVEPPMTSSDALQAPVPPWNLSGLVAEYRNRTGFKNGYEPPTESNLPPATVFYMVRCVGIGPTSKCL